MKKRRIIRSRILCQHASPVLHQPFSVMLTFQKIIILEILDDLAQRNILMSMHILVSFALLRIPMNLCSRAFQVAAALSHKALIAVKHLSNFTERQLLHRFRPATYIHPDGRSPQRRWHLGLHLGFFTIVHRQMLHTLSEALQENPSLHICLLAVQSFWCYECSGQVVLI